MLNKASLSFLLLLILAIEMVYFFIILGKPERISLGDISAKTNESLISGDLFAITYSSPDELSFSDNYFPKIDTLEEIPSDFQGECAEIKFGKCIEIDISDQKFYTYQNGFLIGQYLTSTGTYGRATKLGRFAVQSKYEMAHGYIGGVHYKMPYWLGIYYAGASENGIHELPYINGVKETSKDLGRRVSHGCVRLDEGVAKKVYDWADLGTPVIIHN